MKILVTADWHIGVRQYGIQYDDGSNSRLVDLQLTLDKIIDVCLKEGIKHIFHCGDIFHTCKPSVEEQRIFWGFLCHLMSNNITARFIIGNHDYNSKLGSNHALQLFKDIVEPWGLIKIYDKTTWESFQDDNGSLFVVAFMPYKGDDPDWTKLVEFGKGVNVSSTAVVCHSHLEGAVVGCEPFEIQSDSVTRFSQLPVDFVLAGHFHKPQLLSESKPLAFYPGSIQAVDFNERNDVKGVIIIDTATRKYETVGFMTRRLVQYDFDSSDDIVFGDDVNQSIVKVNIKVKKSAISSVDIAAIKSKLLEMGCHSIAGVNLVVEQEVRTRNQDVNIDNGVANNFKQYVDKADFGDMKQEIIEAGSAIIRQQ